MILADGIPASIMDQIELTPVEDVVLHLLRESMPDIGIGTLIRHDQTFPFILVRRDSNYGGHEGDPRFTDRGRISIQVFVTGRNGDQEAALLSHFIHMRLFDEARERRPIPGVGHMLSVRMPDSPRRVSDWATSTGPVQYADLPEGTWRYETMYDVVVRRPIR